MAEKKAREFTLKQGVKHSYVIDGERKVVEGDGKSKVPMSELQAAAFKDKLTDYTTDMTADQAEATVSGEPVGGASGGASGASAGAPAGASKEAEDAAKAGKK